MNKAKDKFVILGEASESDEDEIVDITLAKKKPENQLLTKTNIKPKVVSKGLIIAGEASESESESEDACREAFFAKTGAVKNEVTYEDHTDGSQYDTLLHKKLRECNLSLCSNIQNESRQTLMNAVKALNSTNQQLLVTQIQVQDAVTSLSKALENLAKLNDNFNTLSASNYIPNIENV